MPDCGLTLAVLQRDGTALERGHADLQDFLGETLAQATYMQQHQHVDRRAIKLLLRSQQLVATQHSYELAGQRDESKQVGPHAWCGTLLVARLLVAEGVLKA